LTINGLKKPLDAQMLSGDRVLVAEHDANRVTVRDLKSKIVWEKKVADPLVAQRLLNGNTFIATEGQLLEVDRDGKEVFSYLRPGGEGFMKAQKLANGEIAYVTTLRQFVRMDSSGHEIQTFHAEVSSLGGRIDILRSGHVLVPELRNNQVVEYDADGRAVWKYFCRLPVAAVRLANGNTLITSMQDARAFEVDRKGKEVWEYQAKTRVTRAFRR
jgi:outer membrane protein assembly factor BamB